jgi:hypothetical protein
MDLDDRSPWRKGESLLAIRARHASQFVQQPSVSTPATTQTFDVPGSRHRWADAGEFLCVRNPGAHAVTVRADDVALVDLDAKTLARHQHRPSVGDLEGLDSRIAVVEVHLMGF